MANECLCFLFQKYKTDVPFVLIREELWQQVKYFTEETSQNLPVDKVCYRNVENNTDLKICVLSLSNKHVLRHEYVVTNL